MALVPVKLSDKIEFFQGHLAPFAQHAAELGLSDAEVAELTDLVADARAARLAQDMAQTAARSATANYNMAVEKMSRAGATAIMKIRTRAESTGDLQLYPLGGLPLPAERSPIDAPGTPFRLVTTLDSNGSLALQWGCKNPKGSSGTTYYLSRSIGDTKVFNFLAITGAKRFVDTTIPPGTSQILYKIQAVRSTKSGQPGIFPVSFGSGGIKGLPALQTPARTMIAA